MMDLSSYQRQAWRHDQHPEEPSRGLTVALLGLGGEIGSLQTNLKKVVRDGPVYVDHHSLAVEDLGDVLWYVADTATWLGIDLGSVADANLTKIKQRWPSHDRELPELGAVTPSVPATRQQGAIGPAHVFDGGHSEADERFPRQLEVLIAPVPPEADDTFTRVLPVWEGRPFGNLVGDNAYEDDGYRYHDCIHLANLAVLGWSPVVRALIGRKRKTTPTIDDVEDGGRAIAIEEGVSAFLFQEASRVGFYESTNRVDSDVLRICQRMTANLEVSICAPIEWERAILMGYACWRELREVGDGALVCDLDARTVTYRSLSSAEKELHAQVCMAAIAEEKDKRAQRALEKAARAKK